MHNNSFPFIISLCNCTMSYVLFDLLYQANELSVLKVVLWLHNMPFVTLKIIFVAFLFFLFICVFGWPSLTKYRNSGTMMDNFERPLQKTDSPSVTICASDPTTEYGWKNSNMTFKNLDTTSFEFVYRAGGCETETNLSGCILKQSFLLSEFITEQTSAISQTVNTSRWERAFGYLGYFGEFSISQPFFLTYQ